MADNVAVTAGSGTTIAADEVIDGTLGTVKVQYVKIMDATLDGTTKAAVGANGLAVAATLGTTQNTNLANIDSATSRLTSSATNIAPGSALATTSLVVGTRYKATPPTFLDGQEGALQIDSSGKLLTSAVVSNANSNGSALQANSAPVTQAPTSFRVAVTPTVTASAYTAGNVLGGIMTFASMLLGTPNTTPTKWSAVLESISVKFKAAAVTGSIEVAVFTASPAGGTYTDKTAPTWNLADTAKLVGIYTLSTPNSKLGTMTCYNLDGIGAAIDGASTSLFVVAVVDGTPTPASTTDVIVELGVLQG